MKVIPAAMRRWLDSPLHWFDTGLRPGRSRWRSNWCVLVGAVFAMHLAMLLVWGTVLLFNGHWANNYHPFKGTALLQITRYVMGLVLFVVGVLALSGTARSWARDNSAEWRDHLSVLPLTSREVIAAKTHLWLSILLISKSLVATSAVFSLGLTYVFHVLDFAPWPYEENMWTEMGDGNFTFIVWGSLQMFLLSLGGFVLWVFSFGFVATLVVKWGRGATAAFLIAAGMSILLTAIVFALMSLASIFMSPISMGIWGYLIISFSIQAVCLLLLAVVTWRIYRRLPALVAKRYSLSS